jgi:hypothetical protein
LPNEQIEIWSGDNYYFNEVQIDEFASGQGRTRSVEQSIDQRVSEVVSKDKRCNRNKRNLKCFSLLTKKRFFKKKKKMNEKKV